MLDGKLMSVLINDVQIAIFYLHWNVNCVNRFS